MIYPPPPLAQDAYYTTNISVTMLTIALILVESCRRALGLENYLEVVLLAIVSIITEPTTPFFKSLSKYAQ